MKCFVMNCFVKKNKISDVPATIRSQLFLILCAAAIAAISFGCDDSDTSETITIEELQPSAREVGLKLATRFAEKKLSFSTVAKLPGDGYKSACEWYGALGVAKLTANQALLDSLVTKFDSFKPDFVQLMTDGKSEVDRYIFGIVPLSIYLETGDASYMPLGTEVADVQQETNQTRNAIDDMFMMTGLQVQAYRATKDIKYLDFMAGTMVTYLKDQQENGLFFHNTFQAPVHWARGNGWFAAGMAEMMRELPETHQHYETIKTGYMNMMNGLLPYQLDSGLWAQVIDMPDDPNNWGESSGSAMFTYAMITGVKLGILDAGTFMPVIDKAWTGLQEKINENGDVTDVCVGTWYEATPEEYMAKQRLVGDGHGQAPVLWIAAELLR